MAVTDRLRADLVEAMKAGDRVRVRVLRATLAAVANAEAVPLPAGAAAAAGGATEVDRRVLTDADVDAILRAEVADREHTIAEVERGGGHDAEADELRAELAVLAAYVARA